MAGSERIKSALTPSTSNSNTINASATATTPAQQGQSAGGPINASRFKESTSINTSLFTLGKIISQLCERQQSSSCATLASSNGLAANNNNNNGQAGALNASSSATNGHLPYRDSVLTWLLKESLGGNAKTTMLATVNASSVS